MGFSYLYFAGSVTTGNRLCTWFNNMRTSFGRATRPLQSGSGTPKLTRREKWLKERLHFLEDHVYRVPARGGKNVSSD